VTAAGESLEASDPVRKGGQEVELVVDRTNRVVLAAEHERRAAHAGDVREQFEAGVLAADEVEHHVEGPQGARPSCYQRGYGDSDKPRGVAAYDVDRLGDDFAALIVALGHDAAAVAAHDWGGGVAWNLAIRHPERVRRLAVIDTPHPDAGRVPSMQEDNTVNWFRTYFQVPWLPEWSARIGHWWLLSKTMRDSAAPGTFPEEKLALYRSAWDRDGAFGTMVNWYRADFRQPPPTEPVGAQRVAMPTLLILAPDDAFIPGGPTRASLQFLDDGRLVELEEGTHWVIQERPGEIAALLAGCFAAP